MNNNGPYSKAYILNYEEGGEYSLERNIPTIVISKDDTIHTVKDGETLHSLAFQYFGDSSKWYVIAEVNHIGNPFNEVEPGMKLRIPAHGIIE